jgi:hypothetical protein
MRLFVWTIVLAIISGSITYAFAASDSEEKAKHLDCADPLKGAPLAVKNALGHLYRKQAPAEKLTEAHVALTSLVAQSTNCRINVQSSGKASDRSLVREWVSLHDWINRLADFVYLESIGRRRVDWQLEYADFAKIYEFEA